MGGEPFFQLIKMELKALAKNRIFIFNSFFLVLLVLLIGSVYQKGVLDRIPTLVADLDQTATSRLITRQFAENDKFQVSFAADYPAVTEALKRGQVLAGVVIPPGLGEAVKSKKGGEILLLVDGTNYIAANSVYSRASEILTALNAGIAMKSLEGTGILPDEAAKIAQGIKLEQKILYNPGYNYAYYLSYGLCGAGIFSLAMTAFALSLCRSIQGENLSRKELGAKLVVFSAFLCILINLLFAILQIIFSLPNQGSFPAFFSLVFGYSFLIALFGMILFSIARREERIFQLGVFFATALFFTTGYTWPLQSIPAGMQGIYYLNPLTPFLNGIRACLVMGAGWAVMGKYVLWQFVLIAVYFPVGFSFYKRSYKNWIQEWRRFYLRLKKVLNSDIR